MVGSGILHDVCRKLIKSLHIEDSVELKGMLSHDEVAELMRRHREYSSNIPSCLPPATAKGHRWRFWKLPPADCLS